MTNKSATILFIGDIIGRPGRNITRQVLPELKKEYSPDLTVCNGENAAAGFGMTEKVYQELLEMGIEVITSGNHIWDKKDFIAQIKTCPQLIRPANFPPQTPGEDHLIFKTPAGTKIGILNLVGRVFMPPADCPFRVAEAFIKKIKKETPHIIIDFHAEATSEKSALGWFVDGKVSAVIGSHTHVQTADERILPQGTAYISDAGMVGAQDSVIGVEKEPILERFLLGMPKSFQPAKDGTGLFNGLVIKIDVATGKTVEIKRIVKTVG